MSRDANDRTPSNLNRRLRLQIIFTRILRTAGCIQVFSVKLRFNCVVVLTLLAAVIASPLARSAACRGMRLRASSMPSPQIMAALDSNAATMPLGEPACLLGSHSSGASVSELPIGNHSGTPSLANDLMGKLAASPPSTAPAVICSSRWMAPSLSPVVLRI